MKKIILVVEDELLIALDVKLILESLGYEAIIGIKTIAEAINKVEEVNPFLVLIDINLGNGEEGTEIGSFLLNKDSIPYIYLTSYSDQLTLEKVNKTRPHGYIVKPFTNENLIATISVVLNNFYYRKIDTNTNLSCDTKVIPFRLKEVVNYINENIEKKLDLDELANLTKWKKHHFNKVFTKYLHVTPYQYILNKKMEKTKILLSDTIIPVNEIAFDMGFQSYSNFCNAFKKTFDITPAYYRKISQEKKD